MVCMLRDGTKHALIRGIKIRNGEERWCWSTVEQKGGEKHVLGSTWFSVQSVCDRWAQRIQVPVQNRGPLPALLRKIEFKNKSALKKFGRLDKNERTAAPGFFFFFIVAWVLEKGWFTASFSALNATIWTRGKVFSVLFPYEEVNLPVVSQKRN